MTIKRSIVISLLIILVSLLIGCESEKEPAHKVEVEEPKRPPCPNLVGEGVYSVISVRVNDEPRKMKTWVDCYGESHSELLPKDYELSY